jgi:hypothetical protein
MPTRLRTSSVMPFARCAVTTRLACESLSEDGTMPLIDEKARKKVRAALADMKHRRRGAGSRVGFPPDVGARRRGRRSTRAKAARAQRVFRDKRPAREHGRGIPATRPDVNSSELWSRSGSSTTRGCSPNSIASVDSARQGPVWM